MRPLKSYLPSFLSEGEARLRVLKYPVLLLGAWIIAVAVVISSGCATGISHMTGGGVNIKSPFGDYHLGVGTYWSQITTDSCDSTK